MSDTEKATLMRRIRANATKAAHPLMGEDGAVMAIELIAEDLAVYRALSKPGKPAGKHANGGNR